MMIKDFIEYLKKNNIPKDDTLKLLKDNNNLSREEKNLIFAYCFPRQLLDRELPIRIKTYREKSGYSHLNIDPSEVALIIEAGQTEQYRRFIKHLMHSFDNTSKIHPVTDPGHTENPDCGICGRNDILFSEDWEIYKDKDPQKEYLALGSTETGIIICKHCLIQLLASINIMNELDPSYLDWTKRLSNL